MATFASLVSTSGFLTDKQIQSGLNSDYLIEKGTWDPGQIRHASYQLRLGSEVRISRASASVGAETKEFCIVSLTPDKSVELRPGDTAMLYSIERLRLPDCVLAFTVARGLLYAEALAPENTYVDPGFSGTLYTTVTNISNRIVSLKYGIPVARLFFFRLNEDVGDPYRSGPALGIGQQLSSVRAVAVGTLAEADAASDIALRNSIQEVPFGGPQVATALARLTSKLKTAELRLYAVAFVWPILLVIANGSTWVHANINGFLSNIVAGVIVAALLALAPRMVNYFGDR